ncbi:helix-turn-helix domain-containing protein [Emticicia sp. 17c]|uniref:helix-turn-helix domain-containing protein n=1 Tax=Emticicia sp. 17c TaxID=3127704 RepID=UPI00301C1F24
MLGYAGWYTRQPYRNIMFYVPFQQLLLLPPILYFYFKSLLDSSFTFTKQHFYHFIPAGLYLLYAVIVVVTDQLVLKEYYFYADQKDKDFSTWYQFAGFLSMTYYLIISLKLYTQYKEFTYNELSFADSVMFNWAKKFLIAFLFLILFRLIFFISNPEWAAFGKKFWYYLSYSFLFYYISINGYSNTINSLTSFTENNIDTPDDTPQKSVEIPDLDILKEKIETLMEVDKIYTNPTLILSDVCKLLNTHPKKVSQVVNQGFGVNFNDFVNEYRIREALRKIAQGEHHLQTLLGIALDCGFNSKSTFNRAFKKYTSLNPKDYIRKNYEK